MEISQAAEINSVAAQLEQIKTIQASCQAVLSIEAKRLIQYAKSNQVVETVGGVEGRILFDSGEIDEKNPISRGEYTRDFLLLDEDDNVVQIIASGNNFEGPAQASDVHYSDPEHVGIETLSISDLQRAATYLKNVLRCQVERQAKALA